MYFWKQVLYNFVSHFRRIWGQKIKLGYKGFLPCHFQFILHKSP